jgi:hypothetical protein
MFRNQWILTPAADILMAELRKILIAIRVTDPINGNHLFATGLKLHTPGP